MDEIIKQLKVLKRKPINDFTISISTGGAKTVGIIQNHKQWTFQTQMR
jgi:hypothetical protein